MFQVRNFLSVTGSFLKRIIAASTIAAVVSISTMVKVLPRVKTNNPSIAGGDRRSLGPLPVDRCRRVRGQRLMAPLAGVKRTIPLHAVQRFRHAAILLARDRRIRHTAPEPFHNQVLDDATTSSPADAHPLGSPRVGQGQARARGPWIGGEEGRRRPDPRALQGGDANTAVESHRPRPRQSITALPGPAGHPVDQAWGPSPGGHGRRPDVIGPRPLHPCQSRGRPLRPSTRLAQTWLRGHRQHPPSAAPSGAPV